MNKKVFLYSRVSTGMQSTGLETQNRVLREHCERMGINNFVIFKDENQSGTKMSGPALDEMMKRARAGECEKVIVYGFSRFARSVTHLLSALQEFENLGVKFISISESTDTETPIGRALFTILGSVSQLERDILVERVKQGLYNARMKGIKIGRKKTRPSELIRQLSSKGLIYREITRIAGCSQGAVASEIKAWDKEKAEGKEQISESDIPPLPTKIIKEENKKPELMLLEIVKY